MFFATRRMKGRSKFLTMLLLLPKNVRVSRYDGMKRMRKVIFFSLGKKMKSIIQREEEKGVHFQAH